MKNYTSFIVLILTLIFTSCEDWLDINRNPDLPEEVEYKDVLPSGITSIAYVMGGRYQVLGALWSQHWTQSLGASQYSGLDSYDINSSTFNNEYGELYAGALKAFEYVRQESFKDQNWNYYLIATVMQCYTFHVLADLYDEIPFSEALKGDEGTITPKFEKGYEIYDSLIARMDYALSLDFDNEDMEDVGSEDVIFNGNIDKWKAFANTLKLKIYLRQCYARPEISENGIRDLYEEEVDFIDEDVYLGSSLFSDETGRRNPLYETEIISLGNNPNLILSYTLLAYMEKNSDFDRLDALFSTPARGGDHKGLAQGNFYDPEEEPGTNSSTYSKPRFYADAPIYLMSESEACFLQAEAIMRYNVADYNEALTKYQKGITADFERFYGSAGADLAEQLYRTGQPYAFPPAGSPFEDFLETIITQKWVSLAGIQSLETFFEQNRTNYPKISDVQADDDNYEPGELTISVNNVTSGRFPKRLIFPKNEEQGNPYIPEPKEVWEEVWWDVKTD